MTAAAAYRSAERILDERTAMLHDYTRRGGVEHTEVMAPHDAPSWVQDRAALWNAVEQAEKRKDAQLAREIQLSLPHELTPEERRELARSFVQQSFVDRGMVADLAIHGPDRQGDQRNHHAHVLLTMRDIVDDGFGKKNRGWNDRELIEEWRQEWAMEQNRALEQAGHDIRVDHRSLADQGIDREPEPKLGPVATKMERTGRESLAGNDLRATWERNAEREGRAEELEIINQEANRGDLGAPERAQEDSGRDDATQSLFDAQRAYMETEASGYQSRIDELQGQLEDRSRVAIFWDKVRGRLGWNAEQELKAQQMELRANQERQAALERAEAMERQQQAEKAAQLEESCRQYEAEAEQAQAQDSILSSDFSRASESDDPLENDYADLFRQAREQGHEQEVNDDVNLE